MSYELKEIEAKLQIPRGRLREWLNAGHVRASIVEEQGVHGRKVRKYSTVDAYGIVFFRYLVEVARLPREVAGRFVNSWRHAIHGESPRIFDHLVFIRTEDESKDILLKYFSSYNLKKSDPPDTADSLKELEAVRYWAQMELEGIEGWEMLNIVNIKKIMDDTDTALLSG